MRQSAGNPVPRWLAVFAVLLLSFGVAPMAGAETVLMLKATWGLGTGELQDQLQGSLCSGNTQCVEVDYPASFSPTSKPMGVVALNTAMDATVGPIVVLGYSQGAEVSQDWLAEHAADPDARTPDQLSFVAIGNATRAYGGAYARVFGDVWGPTRYQVTDIARQYDFFADFPNNPASPYYLLALANAIAGIAFVHLDYTNVNPNDPANAVWAVGNTTYVLTPTRNLPLLQPLRMIGLTGLANVLNSPLKALVEQGYNRPVPFPATIQPTPSAVALHRSAAVGSASVVEDPTVDTAQAGEPGSPAAAPAAAPDPPPSADGDNGATLALSDIDADAAAAGETDPVVAEPRSGDAVGTGGRSDAAPAGATSTDGDNGAALAVADIDTGAADAMSTNDPAVAEPRSGDAVGDGERSDTAPTGRTGAPSTDDDHGATGTTGESDRQPGRG